MANRILDEKKSTVGSPTAYYTVDVTPSNRQLNSIDMLVKVTSHLASSSSSLGTGQSMGLNAYITLNSKEYGPIELKNTTTSWNGTGNHEKSQTFTVTGLEILQESITSVKFRVSRTGTAKDNYTTAGAALKLTSCSSIPIEKAKAKSDIKIPSFDLGNPFIPEIIKYDENFYDVLQVKLGSESLQLYYDVENGASYNLSQDSLNTIYSSIQNTSNKATLTFKLTTYEDESLTSELGYTELNVDANLVNAEPTLTSYNIQDINSNTIALTGSSSKFVKGYSTLRVSNIVCSVNKGANSISKIKVNNIEFNYVAGGTYSIPNLNTQNVSVIVTDNRGNSKELAQLIPNTNWVNYAKPVNKSDDWERSNGGVGKLVTFSLAGTMYNGSFGSILNKLTITYKYKKTTDSAYINGTTAINISSANNFNFDGLLAGDLGNNGFDENYAYNVIIKVQDKLDYCEFIYLVGSGSPAEALYGNCISIGGKYNETKGGRAQLLGTHKLSDNANGKLLIDDQIVMIGLDYEVVDTW